MFRESVTSLLIGGLALESVMPSVEHWLGMEKPVIEATALIDYQHETPPIDKQLPENESSPHNEQEPVQEAMYSQEGITSTNTTGARMKWTVAAGPAQLIPSHLLPTSYGRHG